MKRPSLLPGMLAATLFLAGGLPGEEAKTAAPASPSALPAAPAPSEAEKPDENARQRRAEAIAHEVARRRALESLRADLIALFDKNGNGKFDADEFTAVTVFLAGTDMVVPNPTPAMEQARLVAVTAEVERRRAWREGAAKVLGNARPDVAPLTLEETIRSLRASLERLEKVAAERAKEKAQPPDARK